MSRRIRNRKNLDLEWKVGVGTILGQSDQTIQPEQFSPIIWSTWKHYVDKESWQYDVDVIIEGETAYI